VIERTGDPLVDVLRRARPESHTGRPVFCWDAEHRRDRGCRGRKVGQSLVDVLTLVGPAAGAMPATR
jgi:hypothetical protein